MIQFVVEEASKTTYDDKVSLANKTLKEWPNFVYVCDVHFGSKKGRKVGVVAECEHTARNLIYAYYWQFGKAKVTADIWSIKRIGASKQSKREVVLNDYNKLARPMTLEEFIKGSGNWNRKLYVNVGGIEVTGRMKDFLDRPLSKYLKAIVTSEKWDGNMSYLVGCTMKK